MKKKKLIKLVKITIKATMQVGGKLTHTTITQVLHVPKMKNNLISVSKLISEGFKVEFDKDAMLWHERLGHLNMASLIGNNLKISKK